MDNSHEHELLRELDKHDFILAALVIIVLVVVYFVTATILSSIPVIREFLLGLILNLIPVSLLFVVSYVFFRRIQTIKSEQEVDALASKIVGRIREELIGKQISVPSDNTTADRPASKIQGELIIVSADYGLAGKKTVDVTGRVRSMMSGGRLRFLVQNKRLVEVDPVEGKLKKLKVDFLYAGAEFSITVPEGSTLSLPLQE